MVALVYSDRYDISFFGLERFHPFDSRKYGHAWRALQKSVGPALRGHHITVDRPITDEELLQVHPPEYLATMRRTLPLITALEMPFLFWMPSALIRWRVCEPMRWAVRGSVLAAQAALQHGVAVNLSGGYHHAKPSRGEGFCIYSDIALLVQQLRASGQLTTGQHIVYIDLDAHQGNGVCHQFLNDRDVLLFDMYNESIYPTGDVIARGRLDYDVPLEFGCSGRDYLHILHQNLPGFLDAASDTALAIYNAGTDVLVGDPLGGLQLSAEDVLTRDLFVVEELRRRHIPVVMLPSGGYTKTSYQLIATTVQKLLERTETSVTAH